MLQSHRLWHPASMAELFHFKTAFVLIGIALGRLGAQYGTAALFTSA